MAHFAFVGATFQLPRSLSLPLALLYIAVGVLRVTQALRTLVLRAASADLMAFVAYYEHHVAQSQRNKVIDAQVRTFRHNREHYQKITAKPMRVGLSSGADAHLGDFSSSYSTPRWTARRRAPSKWRSTRRLSVRRRPCA